jgi:ABC-2 type transport system permease protein
MIFEILLSYLPLIAYILLWSTIYSNKIYIKNYTFEYTITYIFIIKVFQIFLTPSFHWEVNEDIKYGKLSNYIIKPINYFKYIFFKTLGKKLTSMCILTVPTLFVGFFINYYFNINLYLNLSTPKSIIFFIFALMGTYILYFQIYYLISLLSFVFDEVGSLFYTIEIIMEFFLGTIIPLYLFPAKLLLVIKFTPFSYLLHFLAQFIIEPNSFNIYEALQVQLIWIILFGFAISLLWKLGIKKYSSLGG